MKEMFVNSHVQMSKGILKNFSNSGCLFYYDVCQEKIRKGNTNLNSQYGFYSSEVEDILSKDIETPLGRIVKYVTNNDFKECVPAPENIINDAKKYLCGIAARSIAKNRVITQNDGIHAYLSPPYLQHDVLFKVAYENAKSMELFSSVFPTFLVNKTDVPLVLPICGLYEFDQIIVAPITQWRAIVWVKDLSAIKKLISEKTSKVFIASSSEDIAKLNMRAFTYECEYNKGCVVSSNKSILQDLLDEYISTQKEC